MPKVQAKKQEVKEPFLAKPTKVLPLRNSENIAIAMPTVDNYFLEKDIEAEHAEWRKKLAASESECNQRDVCIAELQEKLEAVQSDCEQTVKTFEATEFSSRDEDFGFCAGHYKQAKNILKIISEKLAPAKKKEATHE